MERGNRAGKCRHQTYHTKSTEYMKTNLIITVVDLTSTIAIIQSTTVLNRVRQIAQYSQGHNNTDVNLLR